MSSQALGEPPQLQNCRREPLSEVSLHPSNWVQSRYRHKRAIWQPVHEACKPLQHKCFRPHVKSHFSRRSNELRLGLSEEVEEEVDLVDQEGVREGKKKQGARKKDLCDKYHEIFEGQRLFHKVFKQIPPIFSYYLQIRLKLETDNT